MFLGGGSLFTWSNLIENFIPQDRSRKVYGFDHFEGLKENQFDDKDGQYDNADQKVPGGYKSTKKEIEQLVQIHNADNMLPGMERVSLIDGDVMDTIPRFLEENPGIRISLIHFDMDLYQPTKYALKALYPLVVRGGILAFDEYGRVPWEGESNAVDEFLEEIGERPIIRKIPFSHSPGGYIVKK